MSKCSIQTKADAAFTAYMTGGEIWQVKEYRDDIVTIRRILKEHLDVEISFAEAAKFWMWRSEQYDASWLTVAGNGLDKEITEWFGKFLEDFMSEVEWNAWLERVRGDR